MSQIVQQNELEFVPAAEEEEVAELGPQELPEPPAAGAAPAEGQKVRSGDPWDECAESVAPAAEKGTEHPEQEEIF